MSGRRLSQAEETARAKARGRIRAWFVQKKNSMKDRDRLDACIPHKEVWTSCYRPWRASEPTSPHLVHRNVLRDSVKCFAEI